MARHKTSRRFVTFLVPEDEQPIMEWLAVQDNISESIRLLIRQAIRYNGMADAERLGPQLKISPAERK